VTDLQRNACSPKHSAAKEKPASPPCDQNLRHPFLPLPPFLAFLSTPLRSTIVTCVLFFGRARKGHETLKKPPNFSSDVHRTINALHQRTPLSKVKRATISLLFHN
jgi:hypothetical protein